MTQATEKQILAAENAFRRFRFYGDFMRLAPYGSGHINDTYAVEVRQAGLPVRYLLQRINHAIFTEPEKLMDNIRRVCEHTVMRIPAAVAGDASRRVLTLLSTVEGAPFFRDDAGNYWRCYLFIEGAVGYDVVETARQCRVAGEAFGEFQRRLADLPGEPLFETIRGFHDTPRRYAKFQRVVKENPKQRADEVRREIGYILERETFAGHLIALHTAGELPLRVTHNDTKLNNVLIDEKTGEAVCVIDLDTVMPGFAAYDFGDLIRTSTSPVEEDEKDTSLIRMQMPMYKAIVDGYIDAAADFLTEKEAETMVSGGMLMIYENALRFLTDYLEGDVYFKTKYPEHNLVRCRSQIALLDSMETQQPEMEAYLMERYATARQ